MQKQHTYKELIREYDKKRAAVRTELDARRAEIYDMIPRIKEIDDEIARSGFSSAFVSLGDPEKSKEQAKAYKNKCDALLKEKNAILKEAGIPKKTLEPHYDCKACSDTGFIGQKECTCFKQRRIEMAYGSYQLKDRLRNETFDNFDFRYYSSKKPDDNRLSPKKNMERIVKFCLGYTKSFDEKKQSVLFYGSPGLGKTFLCNSVAKELMDRGHIVVYVTAFALFKLLNDLQFGKTDENQNDYIFEDIMKSDLLIVDDVGTEFSTILTGIGFFNILNSRANDKLPVIVSTNLSPEELKELYSERIFSRIIGDFSLFEFYGEDIRTLKKYGRFLE